jgi:DNA-binding NarL/FixJ family response regulator
LRKARAEGEHVTERARGIIKVGIAEGSPFVRRGFGELDAETEGLEVIAAASDGEEILRVLEQPAGEPDVLILDAGTLDGGGIELARDLTRLHPSLGVVVVGVSDDWQSIEEAVGAGARGFLLRSDDPRKLIQTVRVVGRGGDALRNQRVWLALQESVAVRLREERRRLPTGRQVEVLARLAVAATERELARDLGISRSTLRVHLRRLVVKLGLKDTEAVAEYARGHRFVLGQEFNACVIWDLDRGKPIQLFPFAAVSYARKRVQELETASRHARRHVLLSWFLRRRNRSRLLR